MDKKQIYIILSIVVMAVLTAIFAVTFAYGSRPTVTGNTNTNVTILGNATLSYSEGVNLSLNITESDLSVDNVVNNSTVVLGPVSNITIALNTDVNQFPHGLYCSYDIVYTPTVAYVPSAASVAGNLKELVIRAGQSLHENGTVNEIINMSIAGSNEIVLYSTYIRTTSSSPSAVIDWKFQFGFYNLNVNQNDAAGQHPSGKVSIKNVQCSGAKEYWFDTSTCTPSNPCTYPAYGDSLLPEGTSSGRSIYIGQDFQYYACATTLQGHETCLSQPYTQYGLSGHTPGSNFTAAQQASAKQAIYQAFVDSGAIISISDCTAEASAVYCYISGIGCGVNSQGIVYCLNSNNALQVCEVNSSDKAYCLIP